MATKKKVADEDSTKSCANCGIEESTVRLCSRCKLSFYCSVECQTADWRRKGGHKKYCIPVEKRKPESQTSPLPKAPSNCAKCPICLAGIVSKDDSCELPCSHVFHTACVKEFRTHGAAQEKNSRCPLCREDLDSSLKTQFLKGCKLYDEIKRKRDLLLLNLDGRDGYEAFAEYYKREPEVIKMWENCAKAGFLPAKTALENVKLFTKDNQTERDRLLQAANLGSIGDQEYLGDNYMIGRHGFEKNDKKALYWFQKAADRGSSGGQYSVGFCLLEGIGESVDLQAAIHWLQKSAAQGNPNAQHDLGVSYRDGRGVEMNKKTAGKWFKMAALQGHTQGISSLAQLYFSMKEYKKAFPWTKLAAEQGHAGEQFSLGNNFYGVGVGGVSTNKKLAEEWITKSAWQGYRPALEFCQERGIALPEAPSPTSSRFL